MIKYLLLNDGRTVIGNVEDESLDEDDTNSGGLYFIEQPVGFVFIPDGPGFRIQWFDVLPPGGVNHDTLFNRGIMMDVSLVDDPIEELKEAYVKLVDGMGREKPLIEVVSSLPAGMKQVK